MKYERLEFYPSSRSLEIIDQAKDELFPDTEELSSWHTRYIAGHKNRIALDLDLTEKLVPKNSKILEFGAIPLLLTKSLMNCNYDVTGLDINPERYSKVLAEQDINVVKCNIETEPLPFEENSFDVILFNELFEHLRINPIFTLSEVYRVLKPGGQLMLSTPNLRSIYGIRNFLFRNVSYSCSAKIYQEYEKLSTIGHMGHVREYTTTEVTKFLKKIGFDIDKVIFRGQYYGYKKAIIMLWPQLRPFVSYVVKKPV